MFYKGRNLYNLQEGRIINSFQSLLENLDKLTYSSYLCELIDICINDEETNEYLFKELISAFYLLDTDALDYQLLIRAFEIRILKATGYSLSLDTCVKCRKKIATTDYINLELFGGVCENCTRENGIHVSKAAYNALKFLNKLSMDKIYRLNLSKEVKHELEKITTYLIKNNYSRKPKSLEMLNYIKE